MARPSLSTANLYEVSQRCAEVFIASGGAGATVPRLAVAARMSERTFYRYFPTKEDCLRPLFDDGIRRYAAALADLAVPGDPGVAITRAVEATFADEDDVHTRALMATVFDDPALRRVWLQASYEAAHLLRPSVAALIGAESDDIRISVLSSQAALLIVVAMEHLVRYGTPMHEAVRDAARAMFGPPAEEPAPQQNHATPADAAANREE
ncbi:TetR/AcrR family transcriptional regulator [Gordonia neofelifaecis]|uniref:TetR family transcriptional regulator n=1 Tax=Gordonia neofelifaecis NRRL B-59395 TaxID=644548 RepID=F1YEE1_9ACTN|nr:TetR family transcriptional regulator [Gordonia neofelifaecis]EGD56774.1 TetR family transcriptional regulator [Gordonia neofelifaecis NRRL B-59395]